MQIVTMSLKDADVIRVELKRLGLLIRFASVPVSAPSPMLLSDVSLFFRNVRMLDEEQACTGRVTGSCLLLDDLPASLLPLPFDSAADVQLELCFCHGGRLRLLATGLAASSKDGMAHAY